MEPTPQPVAHRSTDVWFDDGTVVLQAEQTLFRVYRGVLAAQSTIFRDMFSISQPDAQEIYDECPLIVLHDSADDLKVFLMAIHDAGYFVHSPISGFKSFSGLLRLSTKYDVDHIRSRMITIFTSLYPSTLVTWVCRKPPLGYKESDRDDFEALNLALELQILSVLPGIYYECARHTTANVFSSPISDVEKEECISSVEKFNSKWCRRVYAGLLSSDDDCEDEAKCDAERLHFLEHKGFPAFHEVFSGPFSWKSLDLCEHCLARGKEIYTTERIHLWNALPSLFGLSAWTELLAG